RRTEQNVWVAGRRLDSALALPAPSDDHSARLAGFPTYEESPESKCYGLYRSSISDSNRLTFAAIPFYYSRLEPFGSRPFASRGSLHGQARGAGALTPAREGTSHANCSFHRGEYPMDALSNTFQMPASPSSTRSAIAESLFTLATGVLLGAG